MCYVVQRSRSLTELLERAVDLIAQEMGTDVCSIYLIDPHDHRLRLMATRGLDKSALGHVALKVGEGITGRVVQEMRWLAIEDASSHPGYRYFPETKEEQFHSFLGVPLAIRNRPVGALVVQTKERRSYTTEEVQSLTAISAQLAGVVENARLIEALNRGPGGREYFDELRAWHLPDGAVRGEHGDLIFEGCTASPGIVIGETIIRGALAAPFDLPSRGKEEETARVQEAIAKMLAEISKIQEAVEREVDEEHALIFSSHILLLNDPALFERIQAGLRKKKSAEKASYDALESFGRQLQGVADPYIRERQEDIWDLRERLLNHLQRKSPDDTMVGGKIVVAPSLAPTLVVELKARGAKGILTERGGPTSHGALLARSMGIPAVTGVGNATGVIHAGECVILDGESGKAVASPTPETLEKYEERARALDKRHLLDLPFCHLPARTHDGVRVTLRANIAVSSDLIAARDNGAEGVGLYRTEFPFMMREEFPTRAEQVRIYQRAYDYFPEGPVTFRLLDLGGDKLLPGNSVGADRNPFSGFRSTRVLLDQPNLIADQVQAFLIAAGTRPLAILIPMVTNLEELRDILARIREASDSLESAYTGRRPSSVQTGVMIEVPAAVELAGAFAREVDFLSIGSNDLIQYTLAADRDNPRAAAQANPYHPAILRMIHRTITAGHAEGKTVSLCGELAGRLKLTLALLALGIDALSLAPGSIPEIKRVLASANLKALQKDIISIIELSDARDIRRELEAYVPTGL